MVSLSQTEVPIKLFDGELPSFEDLKKLGQNVNASERCRIAFRADCENQKDPLLTGLGLFLCGDMADATKKLEKGKDCAQKFLAMGCIYRRSKKYDAAIEHFNKADKAGADGLTILLEKAETYRCANQLDDALAQLKRAANFENVSADLHCLKGRIADMLGETDDAREHLKKAIEIDPAHEQATFQLARLAERDGDEAEAIRLYRKLVQKKTAYLNALLNLVTILEDREEWDEAEKLVKRILEKHPNHKKANMFQKDIEHAKIMVYDEEYEKNRMRQHQMLDIPISDFELSVRSRNCLKKMGIVTIGDLLRTSESELLAYKNFGETSLVEIKKILDSKNLRLGMALENKTADSDEDGDNSQASPEILQKNIEDLELSVRARRALERLGVKTFHDLVVKTESELLGCKNFGVTSLNEIKEKLMKFGLSLRKID